MMFAKVRKANFMANEDFAEGEIQLRLMMLASRMMCALRHIGQTSHHCDQREQHHFEQSEKHHIAAGNASLLLTLFWYYAIMNYQI